MIASFIAGGFVFASLFASYLMVERPSQLKRDAELYKLLPPASPARQPLLDNIELRAKKFENPTRPARFFRSRWTYLAAHAVMATAIFSLFAHAAYEEDRRQENAIAELQNLQGQVERTQEQIEQTAIEARTSAQETRDAMEALREAARAGLAATAGNRLAAPN